jgi:hypothetical protein
VPHGCGVADAMELPTVRAWLATLENVPWCKRARSAGCANTCSLFWHAVVFHDRLVIL